MNSFWTVVHIHHVLWRSAPPHCVSVCVCVCVCVATVAMKTPPPGRYTPQALHPVLLIDLGWSPYLWHLATAQKPAMAPNCSVCFLFPFFPKPGNAALLRGRHSPYQARPCLQSYWRPHPALSMGIFPSPNQWKVFVKVSGCVGQTLLPWNSAVLYLDFTSSRGLAPHWHHIRPAVTLAQGCSNQLGNFKKETENTFKY